MEKNKVLIYGASGYVAQLLLKLEGVRKFEIVLGSRSPLNSSYPVRIFSLDNKTDILKQIQDAKLVINLAGPFKHTSQQLVEACIENTSHYIDIAGEVAELATVFEYDILAKKGNIMLMPGAGFGVVPTDVVANLAKEKLPDATHLKIAYITNGRASRGTLKTVLADINKAGVIVENGVFKEAMPASKTFRLSVNNKETELVYNPWRADLFSARLSTGIQNIETYANFPGFIVRMMKGKLLWLRDFMLKHIIPILPVGPSEMQLKKGSTICHALVSNAKGETATATLYGPEAYVFTAHTLLTISQRILNNDYKAGYQTPNLYGKELLSNVPDLKID